MLTLSPDTLLHVTTATAPYLVVARHVSRLLRATYATLPTHDERGKLIIGYILDTALGEDATPAYAPHHALLLPLRRRSVALFVQTIDSTPLTIADIQSVPPLVQSLVRHAHLRGVCSLDNAAVLVLDVRTIAHDILMQRLPTNPPAAGQKPRV